MSKEELIQFIGEPMRYATHHEPQDETYILTFANIDEAVEFGDIPVKLFT